MSADVSTEIADLLFSPEGYLFYGSPEIKNYFLPHCSVILNNSEACVYLLVELNKAINAGAKNKNVIENETQRNEAHYQQSASVSQKYKVQLMTLTLLLSVCRKRGQFL